MPEILKAELIFSYFKKEQVSLLKPLVELLNSSKEQEKSILEDFSQILKLRFH
ncbi:MAG TPA: hypothetical protein VHY08_15725 [Bacillota bacterium]|nr:hypothetical protein [Bacillota bacterium]